MPSPSPRTIKLLALALAGGTPNEREIARGKVLEAMKTEGLEWESFGASAGQGQSAGRWRQEPWASQQQPPASPAYNPFDKADIDVLLRQYLEQMRAWQEEQVKARTAASKPQKPRESGR